MRTIKLILDSYMKPVETGLPVTSPLPSQTVKQISPFISLEHQGPFTIMPEQKVESQPLPHKGFECVSLLLEGNIQYQDSNRNKGSLDKNDIQWMTAGSGTVSSEKINNSNNLESKFHLIRFWLNLPQADKATKLNYQDIKKADIPMIKQDGVQLKILSGEMQGIKSTIKTFSDTLTIYGIIDSGKGINLAIPKNFNASLYIISGQIKILGEKIDSRKMIWFNNDDDHIWISASADSEFLLLAGEPIDEPMFQYGTFVMNSQEEIDQSITDYNRGKMGMLFI